MIAYVHKDHGAEALYCFRVWWALKHCLHVKLPGLAAAGKKQRKNAERCMVRSFRQQTPSSIDMDGKVVFFFCRMFQFFFHVHLASQNPRV